MLSVKNISVQLGNKLLLNDINLEMKIGELLIIVGANGAGKSTLIKAITNEIRYHGKVLWKGEPISNYPKKVIAKDFAVMSQSAPINFEFNTGEIVLMGRYPHFELAPSQNDLQITQEKMILTGLEEKKQQSFLSLSGGEKQRAHFARALTQVADENVIPKFLVLDEPLNNLDVKYQFELMEIVKNFVEEGNMAIMVVHDLNMAARFANRLLLLKNGETLALGKVGEVFTSELLSDCFSFNTIVSQHPSENYPVVFFQPEKTNLEKEDIHQSLLKTI